MVGAGVGGLACALRLARAGHDVVVLDQGDAPGGKASRVERGGFRFDAGPSLLTIPRLVTELLGDRVELQRVEPVTRYVFADGSSFELSADAPVAHAALEAWSPGAGDDWMRWLGICAAMWQGSVGVLTGPPPWPLRRPGPDRPPPDPRDLLRVRPWHTLRSLARHVIADPRLRLVAERSATYAGADPRRAPAALAVAGWVEHAFGAWHVRGGIHRIVEELVAALGEAGGELRLGVRVDAVELLGAPDLPLGGPLRGRGGRGRVRGVRTSAGTVPAEVVVHDGDAPGRGERSLSGFALMLGIVDAEPGRRHHEIRFPADYDAEFDDVFRARRPVRDPTLYLAASSVTDPGEAPPGGENLFVLANAPLHRVGGGPDWDAVGAGYEATLRERLGIAPERVAVAVRRTPADLERQTGAIGGAIYGLAPHGRLGTLRRPPNAVAGVPGLWRVGGTTHPGGGLPLVLLSGATVAREIGPA